VHPGAADLVGQPRPTALHGRFGGDLQRPLDGGFIRDRRVELDDDRRRDSDGLAVGQLESAVDDFGGRDGGELALHRDGLAVMAYCSPPPGIGRVVTERLGEGEQRAVPVQGACDDLAVRTGQRDVLEPAVTDLDADRRGRQDLGGFVGGPERQRSFWRRLRLLGLLGRATEATSQHIGRKDADRQGRQGPAPVDRR